ncbi:glycerophosphodiester phosphodiesterase family protein [uncultured Microbacterium sp.]|uniref:glycerophosphodiester phosphodiesterase family protein n=1 Tax=uncultured Microbacterium sp. TaxID=191216 RepID=UPI00260DBCB8|nr:glycerophosphodiester phosphodiesterase family protein [uncultured Microbacterium sp.]
MSHPYFERARYPRVLAHRGLITGAGADSGIWENTAAAFAAAHAAGAEYVETDCRVTADGDVVLFHDERLTRMLKDHRAVSQVRTRELRERFAAHGGLLTVGEMLEMFPETRFNIDVKTDAAAQVLGPIIAPHAHRVLVTSFVDSRRERAVSAVLAAGAKIRPATSAGQRTTMRVRAASAVGLSAAGALRGIDALQIPERFGALRVLTPSLLRAARRSGVEVHVWTVNEPAEMRRLIGLGADGVVTDRADLALKALPAAF